MELYGTLEKASMRDFFLDDLLDILDSDETLVGITDIGKQWGVASHLIFTNRRLVVTKVRNVAGLNKPAPVFETAIVAGLQVQVGGVLVAAASSDRPDVLRKMTPEQVDFANRMISNALSDENASVKLLGVLSPESQGVDVLGPTRKGRRSSGESIEVYTEHLFQSGKKYQIDEYVSASVELDGEVTVSHRPTLTRLAVLSVLPGSAIAPGLALQKKSAEDSRTVSVYFAHPDWAIGVNVHPLDIDKANKLAKQINQISSRLQTEQTKADSNGQHGESAIGQLERLVKLLADGHLSEDEFQTLKSKLI